MPVNIKNPAIKRIHADVRELLKDPSDQYHAAPLEDNLFEWHFTIRGPVDTDFAGGVYHGRILLPPDYPFRPPDIIFLTPNGRFKVGVKVCLSISSYHPEHWQPAWGIRLILEALISFFPTPSHGALGGLDWTPEERRRLASESNHWKCYKCGLVKDLLPELRSNGSAKKPNNYAEQIRELHKFKVKTEKEITEQSHAAASDAPSAGDSTRSVDENGDASPAGGHECEAVKSSVNNPDVEVSGETSIGSESAVIASASSPECGEGHDGEIDPEVNDGEMSSNLLTSAGNASGEVNGANTMRNGDKEGDGDLMLSIVAVAIVVAIIAILTRKVLRQLGVF